MASPTARDILNPNIMTVPANWSVRELARFLTDMAITGAPVVDDDGKLVGVVSLTDIAKYTSQKESPIRADEPHDYYLHGWEDKLTADDISSFHVVEPPEATVQEIMTPMIFKVEADTPVREIAGIMIGGRIHRLLVVDRERIIGIVTTMDLLKLISEERYSTA